MQNSGILEGLIAPRPPRRQYKKDATRKEEIMEAVVKILETPHQVRFTTKEIASHIAISEACIYRHYSGKTDILKDILKRCSDLLTGILSAVENVPAQRILDCLYYKMSYLLLFAEKNPGLTRMLTGEALLYENEELFEQRGRILAMIKSNLLTTLLLAKDHREIEKDTHCEAQVELMLDFILAQWIKYSQSGFKRKPGAALEVAAPALFDFKLKTT